MNVRRYPRKTIEVDFQGRDASGAGQLWLAGADLSAGGAFLKSELLLEPGELLVLEFQLPGVPRRLVARARVAWVRPFPEAGGVPGMGVEFAAMREEDRLLLADFIAQAE